MNELIAFALMLQRPIWIVDFFFNESGFSPKNWKIPFCSDLERNNRTFPIILSWANVSYNHFLAILPKVTENLTTRNIPDSLHQFFLISTPWGMGLEAHISEYENPEDFNQDLDVLDD